MLNNGKYQCHHGNMLHIPATNYHLLAANREPYQKAHLFAKNSEKVSGGKKVRR